MNLEATNTSSYEAMPGCPWLPHRAVKPLGSSQSKKRRVQAICLRTLTEQ